MGDLIDGPRELLGVDDKGGNGADGDKARVGEIAAEGRHDHKADVADAVHHRAHGTAEDLRLPADLRQLVGVLVELLHHVRLLVVGDDGAVAGDHLLRVAVQLALQRGALAEDLAHHLAHLVGHQHGEDHRQHGHKGELPAVDEHDGHGPHQRQHAGDQRAEALGNGGGDVLHVVGHAAHDIAVGVGIEIGDGQVVDLFE